MDYIIKFMWWTLFSFVAEVPLLPYSKPVVEAVKIGNFTNLIHQYFLACGYSYLCNPSSLSFLPKDNPPDIKNIFGSIRECPWCSCDGNCVASGDCCPDIYFNLAESQCRSLEFISFKLYYIPFLPGFVDLVNQCPDSTKSSPVSTLCSKHYSMIEQLHNVPVTSRNPVQTFRNKYCAECHSVTDYEEWGLKIVCDSPTDFNYMSSYKDIASLAKLQGCSFTYKLFEQGFQLKQCDDAFQLIPTQILYDKCNQTGFWEHFDDDIAKACESDYKVPYRFYKNIFCYICNPPSYINSQASLISECASDMVGEHAHILRQHCSHFGTSLVMRPYKNVFCYLCNEGKQDQDVFLPTRNLKEGQAKIFDYFGFDQKEYKINFLVLSPELFRKEYESSVTKFLNKYNVTVSGRSEASWYNKFDINVTNLLRHEFATTGHATYCNLTYTKKEFIVPPSKCSCNPTCTVKDKERCCSEVELGNFSSCYGHVISRPNPNTTFYNLKYPMIHSCYLGGKTVTETQQYLCENGSGEDVYSTIPIPVWDNVIYKNAHCFFCNLDSEHLMSVPAMDIKGYCDEDIQYGPITSIQYLLDTARLSKCHIEVFHKNDMVPREVGTQFGSQIISQKSRSFIYNHMVQSWELRTCNNETHLSCNITGTWKHYDHDVFTACQKLDHPLLTKFRKRICQVCNPKEHSNTDLISTCGVAPSSPQSINNVTALACETYPPVDGVFGFKNVFCAQCNGYNILPLPSHDPPGGSNVPDNFNRMMFAIPQMMTVPEAPKMKICSWMDSSYITLNGVNRSITCYPGRRFLQGTCVPLLRYASTVRYSLAMELGGTVMITDGKLRSSINNLTSFVVNKVISITGNTVDDIELVSFVSDRPCFVTTYSHNEFLSLHVLIKIVFLIRTVFDRQRVEAKLVDISTIFDRSIMFSQVNARHLSTDFRIKYNEFHRFSQNCSGEEWRLVKNADKYRLTPISQVLLCPQIVFRTEEFVLYADESVLFIAELGINFTSDKYVVMEDGTARICLDDLKTCIAKSEVLIAESAASILDALNITNMVCFSLSTVCLVLTFLIYCRFPVLRSLPGKNNMILVFAIFISQLTLFVGSQVSGNPTACLITGIASHYFALCMFTSMNICSFHMHNVFVIKGFHDNNSSEFKTLLKYLVYTFGSPFLIVGLNILVSFQLTNQTGYGNGRCFINERISYIVSFYVPVITLCVLNIFLFLRTIYAIRKVPEVQSNKKEKNTVIIYAKLFSITGITWILIIIDANFPITVLSFIIIVLNAGQGIFIFLSFVCNKRVYRLFVERSSSTNSSNSNSTKMSNLVNSNSSNNNTTSENIQH